MTTCRLEVNVLKLNQWCTPSKHYILLEGCFIFHKSYAFDSQWLSCQVQILGKSKVLTTAFALFAFEVALPVSPTMYPDVTTGWRQLRILKISIGIIATQVSASLCNQRVSAEHDKLICGAKFTRNIFSELQSSLASSLSLNTFDRTARQKLELRIFHIDLSSVRSWRHRNTKRNTSLLNYSVNMRFIKPKIDRLDTILYWWEEH